MPAFRPLKERFEDKFIPEPNSGCWLWTAYYRTRDGYGGIKVKNSAKLAHRVSYELYIGKIPHGLELDHKCGVRCCVNPMHLEPVSHHENVLRGNLGVLNRGKSHCPQGHEYAGINLITHSDGRRACRKCARKADRRFKAKRRALRRKD